MSPSVERGRVRGRSRSRAALVEIFMYALIGAVLVIAGTLVWSGSQGRQPAPRDPGRHQPYGFGLGPP